MVRRGIVVRSFPFSGTRGTVGFGNGTADVEPRPVDAQSTRAWNAWYVKRNPRPPSNRPTARRAWDRKFSAALRAAQTAAKSAPAPRVPTAAAVITQADIQTGLKARGYGAGAFTTVEIPRYPKADALRMGVEAALKTAQLPLQAPASKGLLEPTKWNNLVSNALRLAQEIAKRVTRTQKLTAA